MSNFFVEQTCGCGEKEIEFCRFKKPKKHYICLNCKKTKEVYIDSIPGDYVFCKFCNKSYLFLSKSHIEKCSNKQMSYKEYIDKFGRDSIYSEKYRFIIKEKTKEASNREQVKNKIKNGLKLYYQNNKQEVLLRTEKMRNSPNRIKGIRENFANMSIEEHEKRVEASKKSWQNEEIRERRLKGIRQSPKSIEARKKNIRVCLEKEQQIISKPARNLFDFLKKNGCNVQLEYKFDFYSLDIADPDIKLCIEVDGDWWHGNPKFYPVLNKNQKTRTDNDKRKNTFLSNKGWKVLRYWQSDILTSFDKVLDDINIYKTEFLCCQQKQKIV